MSVVVFTLEVDDPGAKARAATLVWIARACHLASLDVRASGHSAGEIKDGGKVLGRWRCEATAD